MPNGYIKTLQNSDKTQVVYPQTVSSAVIVESGNLYGGNSNEFLSDTLGRVVYTTTNQTIAGTKTFSSNTIHNSSVYIKNPSSNYYSYLLSSQVTANRAIYLPNVSTNAGLVAHQVGVAVGSNAQPIYIDAAGIAQPITSTATLQNLVGSSAIGNASTPIYWNGNTFTETSNIATTAFVQDAINEAIMNAIVQLY